MKSLKDKRDRLARRFKQKSASHSERSSIFEKMSQLVLKDLRGSIRDERRKRVSQ